MRRLLVISCSQSKTRDEGLIPAVDRYDGPAFRVLRKYLRESQKSGLKILILSAKYGLIDCEHAITDYDCRLSRAAALTMRSEVSASACHLIDVERWGRIGLCVGANYLVALEGLFSPDQQGICVDLIGGGLGIRLSRLKAWLRDHDSTDLTNSVGQRDMLPEHGASQPVGAERRRKEAS